MSPLEVGLDKIKTNKKRRFLIYKDCTKDQEGWSDPKAFLPLRFDMCQIKTSKKVKMGWWTGEEWDGLRISPEDEIKAWRLNSMLCE